MRFVLGGFDTEMKRIGELLADWGEEVVWARSGPDRVHRAQAYSSTWPNPKTTDVWIECSHEDWSQPEMRSFGITLVDHHNEGDVGYGKPPSEYFEASSIGQVHVLLGKTPNKESKMIAAADHCLRLAYDSRCPGVGREELKDFRMKFYKEDNPAHYIDETKKAIEKCPRIKINGSFVWNISKLDNRHTPWLTETCCYYGVKTFKLSKHGDKYKAFLSNLSSKDLSYFLETQCYTFGVVDMKFGDPKRQFVGVFYSHIYGDLSGD